MLAFIFTCILIELTPGPNMAYLAILSLTAGRRVGLYTLAGITLGLFTIAALAGFGMAELVMQYPWIYQTIRLAGITYLLWLAVECWRQKEISPSQVDGHGIHKKYFLRGFWVNVLNPKAAMFYLTVLPGFLNPDAPIFPQTLLLVLISTGIATLVHLSIVLFASHMQPFVTHQGRQQSVRRVFAVLLAMVALWFALST